jgi:hypothetical protein
MRDATSTHVMKKTSKKLEGEGSYTATRAYNAGLAEHVRKADVAGLAQKASEALEGPEGEALRKAEKAAKRGPQGVRSSKAPRRAAAGARAPRG